MAQRQKRVIPVDGNELVVEGDAPVTVGQALVALGKEDASSVVIDAEVVRPEDYGRAVPPTGLITNQVPISKGGLKAQLLEQEVRLIRERFLAEFPPPPARGVSLDPSGDVLLIENFPLPDHYRPDFSKLAIVTVGYPDVPPAGVHVPGDDARRLSKIRSALGGHVFRASELPSSYRDKVEELDDFGMEWVCYHYDGWAWDLDPRDLLQGDCLYKYVENVYAAISGGDR